MPMCVAKVNKSLVRERAEKIERPGTLHVSDKLTACGRVALTRFANNEATNL